MILYELKCHRGHAFEAWFLNGATYDSQQASGDVSCPHCGTTGVSKAPMAPNIARGRPHSLQGPGPDFRAQEVAEKIRDAVDGLRQEIEENCAYARAESAAIQQVRDHAVTLAMAATAKILEEKLTGAAGDALIDNAIGALPDRLH